MRVMVGKDEFQCYLDMMKTATEMDTFFGFEMRAY